MRQAYQRILALLLAVTLLFSLTACSGGNEGWVAKSGDRTMSAGEYIMQVISAYSEAYNQVADPSKPVLQQTIDGKSADLWITERAMQLCRKQFAVLDLFDSLGLELSADDSASIVSYADNLWSYYGTQYESMGVSKDSFIKIFQMNTKMQKIFDYYYTEGGEKEVPMEELYKLGENDYARVTFIPLGVSEDFGGDKDAAIQVAQGLIDRINGGENLYDVITEYENEHMTESDKESHTAHSSPEEAAVVHDNFVPYVDSSYPDSLIEALKDASFGVPFLYDEEEAYVYVVCKQDIRDSKHFFEQNYGGLLYSLKNEEFDEMLEEQAKSVQMEANDSAVKKYSVAKLGLDG